MATECVCVATVKRNKSGLLALLAIMHAAGQHTQKLPTDKFTF